MPRMLLDLQNRGQLAAGFTTFNPRRQRILDTYKQIGTVIEAFRLNHPAKHDNIMAQFAGRAAMTFGRSSGSTAANGNGSASRSTANWRISPSCAPPSSI